VLLLLLLLLLLRLLFASKGKSPEWVPAPFPIASPLSLQPALQVSPAALPTSPF
jgi:hypothetical protein